MALPTTTPSAYLQTVFAFSGVLIPKPTTIGIFACFFNLLYAFLRLLSLFNPAPVIPVIET